MRHPLDALRRASGNRTAPRRPRRRFAARVTVTLALVAGLLAGAGSVTSAAPPPSFTRYCVSWDLHTQYGAVRACTQTRFFDDFSRVGLLNAHSGQFSPMTNYAPTLGRGREWQPLPEGEFNGGRPVATAFGAASWGVLVRRNADRSYSGKFGWYNQNSLSFISDSGWLPAVFVPVQ